MNARDGDVVLMHDLYKTTVTAACKAIPELIGKGYELVTVSELYRRKGVTLENGKVYRGAHDYTSLAAGAVDAYAAVSVTKTAVIDAADGGMGVYAVTLDDSLFGGGSLTVAAPFADVTLLPEAVRDGPVTVSVRMSGADVSVEVSRNGARMEQVPGGIYIGLPGTNLTAASVAVSVAPSGSRTPIVRSAAVSATVLRAYIDGSAVVGIDADAAKAFRDANADWAKSAVDFVSARGLLSGVSADMFGIYACVTRGMITTVLWRMAGSPASSAALTFTDVEASQYYAPAVAWAAEAGIVSGVGGRRFAPESSLTREQAVVLLYHYGGGSTSGDTGTLPCADWARDAYAWAKAVGVLTETDAAWVRPGGAVSRTEVAVLLYRFLAASLYV